MMQTILKLNTIKNPTIEILGITIPSKQIKALFKTFKAGINYRLEVKDNSIIVHYQDNKEMKGSMRFYGIKESDI